VVPPHRSDGEGWRAVVPLHRSGEGRVRHRRANGDSSDPSGPVPTAIGGSLPSGTPRVRSRRLAKHAGCLRSSRTTRRDARSADVVGSLRATGLCDACAAPQLRERECLSGGVPQLAIPGYDRDGTRPHHVAPSLSDVYDAGRMLVDAEDGRIKLYVTYRGLLCRREHPGLFTLGEYLPAEARGVKQEHVFGFVRRREEQFAVVAAPRLLTGLAPDPEQLPLGRGVWQGTVLLLPEVEMSRRWRNIFTGEILKPSVRSGQNGLPLAEVLANFPLALLVAEE